MGKYPFKIYVKNNSETEKVLQRLMINRNSKIQDKNLTKSIGWKIKPIRKDVRITRDYTFDNSSFIHLEPFIKMKHHKNKFIFEKKF